jgi:hypothetical protein
MWELIRILGWFGCLAVGASLGWQGNYEEATYWFVVALVVEPDRRPHA